MTSREEAERILSSANDDDLIEIGADGTVYVVGSAPSAAGKRIPGISDPKGEYGSR
ncbi:hypothetical protein OG897_22065 [Streptomyces sp. NBC_00237]|uniref:hypothetical protein n=1 Tax=Streptomyces sp. NBC_00237 TaxID=2975687 RepID=UPI002258396D|nr:hypothetical protein [Streptomyces sp. NBC_00237]MCX5204124.1 hypothetical protein [Streptomyces sp. NBC_00237]